MQSSRTLKLLCLLALATPAAPEQIHYDTLPQSTIQQRLDRYKGNDTVREIALKQLFTDAGCTGGNLVEQSVPGRKQPNVICTLPGTTPDTIIVGAHFDHVTRGDGIVDNWSGVSLLPSLYQGLAGIVRRHTYIFVGFTGEEAGLLGSEFYAAHLAGNQIARTEVMINLDTLGLGPTLIWTRQSDPVRLSILAGVAKAVKLPVHGLDVDGFGESDEESFIKRKVCAVMVHSLTPENAHILHGPDDNASAIRPADLYDTYRLMQAYLATLDTVAVPSHVCTAQPVELNSGSRSLLRMPRGPR